MSRYIATRAIRGASALVTEAELMLQQAINEKGAETKVTFPNTAYFMPTILGMTGETVETLISEELSSGTHFRFFDGRNLASGVYLVVLETGKFRFSRKMLLLK